MNLLEAVGALYEARPYPALGMFSPLQPLSRDGLPLLNYHAAYSSCFGTLKGAAERPRILVAGCGTFEPIAVASANPGAEVLAVDLSARTLSTLKKQARWRRLSGRIRVLQCDLEAIPRSEGRFDYVIATGVLHHLENPERALRQLITRTYPKAVFRCMVYSQWGRDLLYSTKEMARLLGIDTPKKFRQFVATLPANHPYRIYFHLYDDAKTDAGLCDGYLHPHDVALDALGWGKLLAAVGLDTTQFLQRPEGQPAAADALTKFSREQGVWDRMALLEALGYLEENFYFLARRASEAHLAVEGATAYVWNPCLKKKGRLFSKLVGEYVDYDTARHPCSLDEATRSRLVRGKLLLPKGGK